MGGTSDTLVKLNFRLQVGKKKRVGIPAKCSFHTKIAIFFVVKLDFSHGCGPRRLPVSLLGEKFAESNRKLSSSFFVTRPEIRLWVALSKR